MNKTDNPADPYLGVLDGVGYANDGLVIYCMVSKDRLSTASRPVGVTPP